MKNKLMKRIAVLCLCGVMGFTFAACSSANTSDTETADSTEDIDEEETEDAEEAEDVVIPVEDTELEDGFYTVEFNTDSSMFHVNDIYDGKATMIVSEGAMTMHIVMPSQNIVNLYLGTADEAQQEGAELIQPDLETVTYEDGSSEDVYAFDVPVPVLDEEFDLALIGTKGKWYDHKVSVSNPQLQE